MHKCCHNRNHFLQCCGFHKSQGSILPLCEVKTLCISLWLFFISDDLFWLLNSTWAVLGCSSLLRQVLSTLSHPSESLRPVCKLHIFSFRVSTNVCICCRSNLLFLSGNPTKGLREDWVCFHLIAQPLGTRSQLQICPPGISELLT